MQSTGVLSVSTVKVLVVQKVLPLYILVFLILMPAMESFRYIQNNRNITVSQLMPHQILLFCKPNQQGQEVLV